MPRLLAEKDDDEPIRIWSAGCASGEEAYTLAMVAAEALGPEAVRERVKIYATDVDEEALSQARQARYTAKQVEGVPPELLERLLRAQRRRLRLPQGPAAVGHLRPPRPDPGRPHLPASTCWSAATP